MRNFLLDILIHYLDLTHSYLSRQPKVISYQREEMAFTTETDSLFLDVVLFYRYPWDIQNIHSSKKPTKFCL